MIFRAVGKDVDVFCELLTHRIHYFVLIIVIGQDSLAFKVGLMTTNGIISYSGKSAVLQYCIARFIVHFLGE